MERILTVYTNPRNIPKDLAAKLRSLSYRHLGEMSGTLSRARRSNNPRDSITVVVIEQNSEVLSWALRFNNRTNPNRYQAMCYTRAKYRRQGLGTVAAAHTSIKPKDRVFKMYGQNIDRARFWAKVKTVAKNTVKNSTKSYKVKIND